MPRQQDALKDDSREGHLYYFTCDGVESPKKRDDRVFTFSATHVRNIHHASAISLRDLASRDAANEIFSANRHYNSWFFSGVGGGEGKGATERGRSRWCAASSEVFLHDDGPLKSAWRIRAEITVDAAAGTEAGGRGEEGEPSMRRWVFEI